MADFIITQGSTRPVLRATLEDDTGTAVSLTGATVTLSLRSMYDDSVIFQGRDVTVLIPDPSGIAPGEPNVQYTWQSGDTATTGTFYAQWKVAGSDGGTEYFPTTGPFVIAITPPV